MVSDFSAINGEVVVIDGEWLKGAGQFNMLKLFRGTLGPTGNDDKSKEE
jgi:hypothetical protein